MKFQLYGLYVYYVVHICDFGMLRVKDSMTHKFAKRQKTLKLEMTGDDWGQIMTFNSGQLIK